MKNKKGITLIALVITIVVLLILAGISISMLGGENGIITRAIESKEENRGGAVEERRDLWLADIEMDKNTGSQTAKELEEVLAELKSEGLLSDEEIEYIKENGYIQIGSHFIEFNAEINEEIDWSTMAPGLYETGTKNMIKSWNDLIDDLDIFVEGTKLVDLSTDIEKGDLIISNNITEIAALGSQSCYDIQKTITGISLPNTIKEIPFEAFCKFQALKKVVISEGSIETIGYYAFAFCDNLTYINIPKSVTSIGDFAFSGCSSLNNIVIPSGVTSLGNNVFYGCSSLTSIEIPDSVISIGNETLSHCYSLANITVDKNNKVYDSRDNCNAIIETATNALILGCKNTIIPNSVTKIEKYAFYGCGSLTSIEIPNSVISIENNAFNGCRSLTNIVIPSSVTSIGASTFWACDSLISIKIPNSVTSIGSSAFAYCENLTSIEISNSITTIEGQTFRQCSRLNNIVIPSSVTKIGKDSFWDCSSLTSIEIPSSVTIIENDAFRECKDLTTVNYIGTMEQWKQISIGSYNTELTNAKIICTDGEIN